MSPHSCDLGNFIEVLCILKKSINSSYLVSVLVFFTAFLQNVLEEGIHLSKVL